MDTMTLRQGFDIVIFFLQQFQNRGPFTDTGLLLQSLIRVQSGAQDAEGQALWLEWSRCTQKVQEFTGSPEEFSITPLPPIDNDGHKDFPDSLTITQVFLATQFFLYQQYLKTNNADGGIFFIVGNMDLSGWANHMTTDPAYWGDWIGSVQKVLFPDTINNRRLLQDLLNRPENYLGKANGSDWYARLLPNGSQLWACHYNGELRCAGIRRSPVDFDPVNGLSTPQHP